MRARTHTYAHTCGCAHTHTRKYIHVHRQTSIGIAACSDTWIDTYYAHTDPWVSGRADSEVR